MSRSFHVTRKDFKGKSKTEIDQMANDSDSLLHEWADKRIVKKGIRKRRKSKKEEDRLKLQQEKSNSILQ